MPWQNALDQYLTPRRQRFALAALCVIYALFLTYHITAPFIGTSEAFNGTFGIAAANWLRLGPIKLAFTQMTPFGNEKILTAVTDNFVLTHPQFFIAPAALSYVLFGIGEWQTRLAPVIFSLLSLAVFWALMKRVFKTPSLVLLASLGYIFFPISIFYGRMLTQEPITLFFVLALFWATIAFEEEKKSKYLLMLSTTVFLGGLMDWEFFFAAAAAFGYIAWKRDYPDRFAALVLVPATLMASLGVTLLQIWAVADTNPISFLRAIFLARSPNPASILPLFLVLRSNFDLINFSEIGLILAAIGLVSYVSMNKKNRGNILFAIMLAAPGVLTYVVFFTHATVHQFIGFYFIPPIALAAAWGLHRIRRAWVAGAVFAIFMVSCLWYAGNLFAYKSFADDDFLMLKRADAAIPLAEAICMGENSVNDNIKFYLFPHQMDDTPCPPDKYFVLRAPESYAKKDPSASLLQSFFTQGFFENLHLVSFAAAAGIEVIKSSPFLKQKVETVLASHDPHANYAVEAKRVRDLVDSNHLRAIDCSTYFCLYKKT